MHIHPYYHLMHMFTKGFDFLWIEIFPCNQTTGGFFFLSKFKIDLNQIGVLLQKYKRNQKRKEKGIRKIGRGRGGAFRPRQGIGPRPTRSHARISIFSSFPFLMTGGARWPGHVIIVSTVLKFHAGISPSKASAANWIPAIPCRFRTAPAPIKGPSLSSSAPHPSQTSFAARLTEPKPADPPLPSTRSSDSADYDPTLPSARGAPTSDSGCCRPLLPSPPRHRDRLVSRSLQVTLPSLETLRSARNVRCRCIAAQDLDAGDDFLASRNPNHLLPSDLKRRDPIRSLTQTVTLDPAHRFLIRSNDPEGRSDQNGINESGSAAWQPED
jgi:hypothetical protein